MKELTAVLSLSASVWAGNDLVATISIPSFPSAIPLAHAARRVGCIYHSFSSEASKPGTVLARKEGWSLEI
jgi:hypothetical protein